MTIGLRYEVGGDWLEYSDLFDQIAKRPLGFALSTTDPAYGLINWAAAQAGLGIWAVNTACAAVFTAGLISLCSWQPKPRLALLVAVPYLVIVVSMGYTRQSAAIGMIMLAITQLHRESLFKTFACLLTAILFHRTAVLMLPIFVLSISHRGALGLLLGAGLAFAAFRGFLSSRLDQMVQIYVGYGAAGALVRVLMTVLAGSIFLLFRKRFGLDPVQNRLWTLFSLASFLTLAALVYAPSSAGVDRAGLYLIPLQVIVFARVPVAFSAAKRSTISGVAAVAAYSAVVELVWLNFGQFSRVWIPYQNFLIVWLSP